MSDTVQTISLSYQFFIGFLILVSLVLNIIQIVDKKNHLSWKRYCINGLLFFTPFLIYIFA